MSKIPYSLRLEPELLQKIKDQSKIRRRNINNMFEVLLEYGILYLNEHSIEPEIEIRTDKIQAKSLEGSNSLI